MYMNTPRTAVRRIVCAAVLLFTTACGATTEPRAPLPLVASVGFDKLDVVVLNQGGAAWTRVRLMLNPTDTDDGFYFDTDEIRAGATFQKAAALFADAKGERFNAYRTKPQTFRIRAAEGTWAHTFVY